MNPSLDSPPPVTFPHPIYVQTYSFGLAILYILITVVDLFQIIRILCYKHNLLHYQFFFLALCLMWSVLRSVFWLVNPWSPLLENILQIFSIWSQFAMFAFLVLFFVQVVYKAEGWWTTFRVRIFTIYVATVTVFFLGYLTILVLAVEYGSNSNIIDMCTFALVAAMFLLLSLLLVHYTYKLWNLKSNIKPQLPPNRGKVHILLMTIILCVVFLSRSVKAIISMFGVGAIGFAAPQHTPPGIQALLFFMYFSWEVLPTSLVILLFWHIPHTQKLLWGKFNNPPFGSDIPNIAYDSDLRRGAINVDGSTTDDGALTWDGVSRSLFTEIPQTQDDDDIDDPSTPVFVHMPGSFPGDSRYTPYNTKSPLLASRR